MEKAARIQRRLCVCVCTESGFNIPLGRLQTSKSRVRFVRHSQRITHTDAKRTHGAHKKLHKPEQHNIYIGEERIRVGSPFDREMYKLRLRRPFPPRSLVPFFKCGLRRMIVGNAVTPSHTLTWDQYCYKKR
jgi:hypothetical protein